MVLSPIAIALPIVVGLLLYWANAYYDRLLVYKVSADLTVADQHLQTVVADTGQSVAALASSYEIALAAGAPARLKALLARAARERGLAFLLLLDARGHPVAAAGSGWPGESSAHWPVVREALAGNAAAALDVFSAEQLDALDPALAARAFIPAPAVGAPQETRVAETRGLVVHAAAPVRDAEGRVTGALQAGVLLNGNLAFVDRINELVYREGTLPLGSRGTATLFLDDLRIATNVRLFEGERALGTRVSLDVRDSVLGRGNVWLDRAFVVNDWYVSGYQPIHDSFGRRVGMLYVGFLEEPFRRARAGALGVMTALFAGLAILASVFFLRWARTIFAPLERMNAAMSAVTAGDAGARVGETGSRDEIGELARHFDRLLDTLAAKTAELERLNAELDRKVAERTAQLELAQKQLFVSEKLAAIGELTAGVAHEINNPVAVIQGNLDLMRELLGERAQDVANELKLAGEQVNRIRLIVTKLLQFARPGEYAGYLEDVDPNAAVADTLVLVRHLVARGRIGIVEALAATRRVRVARVELQQVLVNLMVNAIQAMPEGGTLTVATADWDERGVRITVRDTGTGIRPEDLSRVFDPFFTTKKREGTGLGLSISYALVERYGGRITVESRPGEGAAFTVWLLAEPAVREAGGAGAAWAAVEDAPHA
ncbi:MAG: cache domain-containing protein [Burkholderiales bacterium]|nr:cache domain-containing protein [Burkholderiales bacterium]